MARLLSRRLLRAFIIRVDIADRRERTRGSKINTSS
jgi:hypothetical protein